MRIYRDWSELPSELLEHIVEHVVLISDFIRFRSVCKSWRSAALQKKLRPQPPLLLLPYNPSNPDRYIFSFTTGRTHHLYLPQLVGKRVLNTSDGWMLLVDTESNALSILNPVSSDHIQLPSSDIFESPIIFGHLFHDVLDDRFVVLIPYDERYQTFEFCKVGDESWSTLDFDLDDGYEFMNYHKGKFFLYHEMGDIYTIDASHAYCDTPVDAGSVWYIPEYSEDCRFHNIVSDGKELLLIYYDPVEDKCFSLCKLDYDGPQIKWSTVQCEDYSLFVCWLQHLMFDVKDFPQYKENCYYSYCKEENIPGVSIFDWEDGTIDFVACGWEEPSDFNKESKWITITF